MAALAFATQMADTNSYDLPTTPPSVMGITGSAADCTTNAAVACLPGANKAMKTANDARGSNTTGSDIRVPSSRAVSGWESTWTLNKASMSTWAGWNTGTTVATTEGNAHKWFVKASELTA